MWADELRQTAFWKAQAAEFLGTGILIFVGCAAAVTSNPTQGIDSFVTRIAFTFGLTVATVVWCTAGASGGHINPAVTFAFLITRKISLLRGTCFILSQLAGAMVGAGLLYAVTTAKLRSGSFGCNAIGEDVTEGQAILVEIVITFVLVFTVFATCDDRRKDLNGSGPLAIGISVLICHLAAIPLSGSGMNPARSFGPAVVRGGLCWSEHYVYWTGPLIGGAVGGLIYELFFAVDASLAKLRLKFLGHSEGYEPVSALTRDDETVELAPLYYYAIKEPFEASICARLLAASYAVTL